MKKVLFLLIYLISYQLNAQEVLKTDSLKEKHVNSFQLYLAPGYSTNQFAETYASFMGVYLGIAYMNKIDLNISYSFILDNFQKQIIFPTTHKYSQDRISLSAQYAFFKTAIRPHCGISYHYNRLTWNPIGESSDTYKENLNMYEVFIGVNWTISKVFSLSLNGGYLFTDEVDLVGLENEDFDGININSMLKVMFLRF